MPALSFQYFIVFAVFGCIGPYFAEILSEDYGLGDVEIGYIFGISSFAVVISPVLITLLADAAIKPRWLMMAMYLIGGTMLGGLLTVETGESAFWFVLIFFCVYVLALVPTAPLQDGMTFAAQIRRKNEGKPELHYHRIRIWGSIGYVAPAVPIFFVMNSEVSSRTIIIGAIGCCLFGAINAFFLPDVGPRTPVTQPPGPTKDGKPRPRIPTVAAAKAMLEPHIMIFAIAIFLAQMAVTCYYTFYPRYLVHQAGIELKWAGLIASTGVIIEIPFMLGFAWLMRKLGWKKLMVLGVACMAARMAMLGLLPGVESAIGSQIFHGLWVITIHVAPPLFLNRFAKDEYRNSIQGLFAMLVFGGGRIIGNIVGGHVAERDLTLVFTYSAGLCLISLALFFFVFKDVSEPEIRLVVEDAPSEM